MSDIERFGIIATERLSISLGTACRDFVSVCTVPSDTTAGIEGQVAQVLAALDGLLEEAGTGKSQLLTATVWLRRMADYPGMVATWNRWVDPLNPPAFTCCRADMARPDILVEIKLTAARPIPERP